MRLRALRIQSGRCSRYTPLISSGFSKNIFNLVFSFKIFGRIIDNECPAKQLGYNIRVSYTIELLVYHINCANSTIVHGLVYFMVRPLTADNSYLLQLVTNVLDKYVHQTLYNIYNG